jgi:hypothetical protein
MMISCSSGIPARFLECGGMTPLLRAQHLAPVQSAWALRPKSAGIEATPSKMENAARSGPKGERADGCGEKEILLSW